ncbi:S-locus glycoprotein domain-containing protein [Hirschfeldia incana]|nr:S-locus glycoprotein domain-containing protein [Hirschfeldia incana]
MRTQSMRDGDLIFSEGKRFAFGFFSLGVSKLRYVGIWYAQVSEQTVVWVANRDRPMNDTSGVIRFSSRGNLCIYASVNTTEPLWSTNVSDSIPEPTLVARLSALGNLLLLDTVTKKSFWESFDHPTDSSLPFMRLGFTRKDGLDRALTSWKSPSDPGSGTFTLWINRTGFPQLVLYKGLIPLWRTGSWTGLRWSGAVFQILFVNNQDEVSMTNRPTDASVITRMMVNETGSVQRLTWSAGEKRWNVFWSIPKEECDYYAHCGLNGYCHPATSEACTCLPGFEPKMPRDWLLRDYTGGCSRKNETSLCREKEGFVKLTHSKIPDTSVASVDMNITLKECEQRCLLNCSCAAYASAYYEGVGGEKGCLTWHGDMLDTRSFLSSGQDIYIRVDREEIERWNKNGSLGKRRVIIIVISLIAALMLLAVISFCYVRKRRKSSRHRRSPTTLPQGSFNINDTFRFQEDQGREWELPLFELNTIATATNNFAFRNKLGEGGFGPVYKGVLENGMEIAVKSFGVLILEIITGKKNSAFHKQSSNLVGHIWDLWNKGEATSVVDKLMNQDIYDESEVMKCVHIGLLCVQENASDRPDMPSVVSMFGHNANDFPPPKHPAFTSGRKKTHVKNDDLSGENSTSVNDVTLTSVHGR